MLIIRLLETDKSLIIANETMIENAFLVDCANLVINLINQNGFTPTASLLMLFALKDKPCQITN